MSENPCVLCPRADREIRYDADSLRLHIQRKHHDWYRGRDMDDNLIDSHDADDEEEEQDFGLTDLFSEDCFVSGAAFASICAVEDLAAVKGWAESLLKDKKVENDVELLIEDTFFVLSSAKLKLHLRMALLPVPGLSVEEEYGCILCDYCGQSFEDLSCSTLHLRVVHASEFYPASDVVEATAGNDLAVDFYDPAGATAVTAVCYPVSPVPVCLDETSEHSSSRFSSFTEWCDSFLL